MNNWENVILSIIGIKMRQWIEYQWNIENIEVFSHTCIELISNFHIPQYSDIAEPINRPMYQDVKLTVI